MQGIRRLYKQAMIGDCNVLQPSVFAARDRAKWGAWYKLKGMSCQDARAQYLSLLRSHATEWRSWKGLPAATIRSPEARTVESHSPASRAAGNEEDAPPPAAAANPVSETSEEVFGDAVDIGYFTGVHEGNGNGARHHEDASTYRGGAAREIPLPTLSSVAFASPHVRSDARSHAGTRLPLFCLCTFESPACVVRGKASLC